MNSLISQMSLLPSLVFLVPGPLLLPLPVEKKLVRGEMTFVTPVPGDGVIGRAPVAVVLPRHTPYAKDSVDEQLYLKGFCMGYLDSVNGRLS